MATRKLKKKDVLEFIDEASERYPKCRAILQTVKYRVRKLK